MPVVVYHGGSGSGFTIIMGCVCSDGGTRILTYRDEEEGLRGISRRVKAIFAARLTVRQEAKPKTFLQTGLNCSEIVGSGAGSGNS